MTRHPGRVIRAVSRRLVRKYRRHIVFSTMESVELSDRAALRRFFLPERPGPQEGLQALGETRDLCLVDRWPEPRAVVVVGPGALVLAGDPEVLRPAALRALAHRGRIDAPPTFGPVLKQAYSDLRPWIEPGAW